MPPKGGKNAIQEKVSKKVDDKTFGMKNKKGSKAQQYVAQMKAVATGRDTGAEMREKKEAERRQQMAAMDSVLFAEAKTKKEKLREKENKIKAAAAAACEEKGKKDMYVDLREQKRQEEEAKKQEGMEDWDQEQLLEAVNQKQKGQRVQTEIVCKHFLDAIEKKTYGWFWECPNGGDKCQYRHCLPAGYVLKSEAAEQKKKEGIPIEEQIEERRLELKTRTPVTLDRLKEWLAKKKEAAAEKEAKEAEAQKKEYAKTKKTNGLSGRALFMMDATLFEDDDEADAVTYKKTYGGGGGDGDGDGGDEAAAAAEEEEAPIEIDLTPLAGPSAEQIAKREAEVAAEREKRMREKAEAEAAEAAARAASEKAMADARAAAEAAEAAGGIAAIDIGDEDLFNEDDLPDEGGGGGGAGPSSAAPDLSGVDESLFLDEEPPDDDELEEIDEEAAKAAEAAAKKAAEEEAAAKKKEAAAEKARKAAEEKEKKAARLKAQQEKTRLLREKLKAAQGGE